MIAQRMLRRTAIGYNASPLDPSSKYLFGGGGATGALHTSPVNMSRTSRSQRCIQLAQREAPRCMLNKTTHPIGLC